jgi:hypothetical protein
VEDVLELHYSIKHKDRQVSNVDYIQITKTACHFGGERPWFVCPGCNKKALVLYIVNRFRCRKCHGLYHPSSNEGHLMRSARELSKYQNKLNGKELRVTDGLCGVTKPLWMRNTTFIKLYCEAHAAEKKFGEQYRRVFLTFSN